MKMRVPAWQLFAVVLVPAVSFTSACQTVSPVDQNVVMSIKPAAPATGLLKVHPANPRYFSDGSGKAIYLTGSHHWNNLLDSGEIGHPLRIFDYDRYLNFLTSHNHNFMRMWIWEGGRNRRYVDLFPYVRTGPRMALDGKPQFDLDHFDQDYFERLHSRVVAAQKQGIYVSIMLFNGWSIYDHGHGNPWSYHPFNRANNMNGINGDPDGDEEGKEVHTLQVPVITERQQAYVRKVIDTVNHLDNVLYEITNETASFSKDWQYHMIRFIHNYEATKPKQHPVGMTSFDASWEECGREKLGEVLLSSPADWISPCSDESSNYATNPPPGDGKKVVLSDTDHIFGIGGDHNWVWKTFTRGLNPIYMDPLDHGLLTGEKLEPQGAATARKAMGDTRSYANKIDLAAMVPHSELCSTTYCLASSGEAYIVYLPFGPQATSPLHRMVTVDLSGASGELAVKWFNPITGEVTDGGTTTGGGHQNFTAPFAGDAVLYLSANRVLTN